MRIYDIEQKYNNATTSVVAENMAEAERIYLAKYWPCTITAIRLHSDDVLVQGIDEQPKNSNKDNNKY